MRVIGIPFLVQNGKAAKNCRSEIAQRRGGTCRHLYGTLPLQGKSRPYPKAIGRKANAWKRTEHSTISGPLFLGSYRPQT